MIVTFFFFFLTRPLIPNIPPPLSFGSCRNGIPEIQRIPPIAARRHIEQGPPFIRVCFYCALFMQYSPNVKAGNKSCRPKAGQIKCQCCRCQTKFIDCIQVLTSIQFRLLVFRVSIHRLAHYFGAGGLLPVPEAFIDAQPATAQS